MLKSESDAAVRLLAALESRAGLRLLDRNDRGVTPASAWLDLAAGPKRVFELLDGLALDLNAVKTGVSRIVRVHAHICAMTPYLVQAIAAFRHACPDIEIILEERTSIEVIHAVNSSSADLGLISGTVDASGLNILPWMRDELVAIVPTGHPSAAQLLVYPFIAMQRGSVLLVLFEQSARRIGEVLLPKAWATVPGRAIASLHIEEAWSIREINLCFRDPARLTLTTRKFLDQLARDAIRLQGPSRGVAYDSRLYQFQPVTQVSRVVSARNISQTPSRSGLKAA